MKRGYWIFLFLYTVVLLLLLDYDSPLYDIYPRSDSAWLFTAGKAWMNGLVPYVDFADSKGPLIWLIYGLGYLIRPTDFQGIFLLTVPTVLITLYFVYRLGLLSGLRPSASLTVAVLTGFILFNPWIRGGVRSETFCWPFISLVLYMTLAALDGRSRVPWAGFGVGLSVAACFLIKFNIAAMLLPCCLYTGVAAIRQKEGLKSFGWQLGGFCCVVLPFFLCFLYYGNVKDFIREYFVCTTQTVTGPFSGPVPFVVDTVRNAWHIAHQPVFWPFFVSLAGTFFYCRWARRGMWLLRYAPLLIHLWFVALTLVHCLWTYYFQSCSVFFCFSFIGMLKLLERGMGERRRMVYPLVVAGACLAIYGPYVEWYHRKMNYRPSRFHYCEYLASQMDRPRMLFPVSDNALGISVHSLPACKYWAIQNGALDAMYRNQLETIQKGVPDFIFFTDSGKKSITRYKEQTLRFCGETLEELLQKSGYVCYPVPGSRSVFYARAGLQLPSPSSRLKP